MNGNDAGSQALEKDSVQRRRAIEESDRSFVVEASAGTGKTSTLVRRILHLALEKGPAGAPLPLSRICAITYTEKAAGEMKVRLRQHFEEVVLSRSLPDNLSSERSGETEPVLVQRAADALRDLETASISTFHSFAVSLLKERPIEAGLDPRFTALDEIGSELFFREVWELWIGRALEDRNQVLERALRGGFSLGSIEELARTLSRHKRAVDELQCDSPPDDEEIRKRAADLLERGRSLAELALQSNDKLVGHLESALQWLKDPRPDNPALPSRPGNAGAASNWKGGKETVRAAQTFVREVVDFCELCRKLPAQRLLDEVIRWIIRGFLPEWNNRKREKAALDFDDQLLMARDLLKRCQAVRREFQERYGALLVDEFQDTDAVQWDIVRLLASDDCGESDPEKLRPARGKLFVVGDPKQSIYRFRNADIETYLGITRIDNLESLNLERLQLTKNFRSVPSILNFVDAAFAGVMKVPPDGLYQPDYSGFGGAGKRSGELSAPSVSLLGDNTDSGASAQSVREFLTQEASRIAALIGRMVNSDSWRIQDRGEGNDGPWRWPRYGDIAVLLPVLTRADILEEALREAEIPYVLEGGKFYYARSEVSSAVTVLRSVANPNDSVALYGALRSIFFGLSDEDLLRARMEGQPLDYRVEVPQHSPLHFPFEVLRDLHRHRHERPASESFETLLQKTGAREVLAARGFQSLANLSKLARTLRALQGEATFSEAVDLLSTMDEEGLAESESRLMEERSDAVRVMSIHKAKGLDFPIVLVASLGLRRITPARNFLADFHNQKLFGVRTGSRESGLHTSRWDELIEEEKKREAAELVRLLYVALTRARDHLVVSTHTQDRKSLEAEGRWVPDMRGTRLEPIGSFLENCMKGEGPVRLIDVGPLDARVGHGPAVAQPSAKDWVAAAHREYAQLRALLAVTPSAEKLRAAGQIANVQDADDGASDEPIAEAAAGRAIRLGTAFHEAMERVNFLMPENLIACVQASGVRHKLDPAGVKELERMVSASLASELLGRARAAAWSGKRLLRELPFVRPLEGSAIEEGKIDLLFEEGNGWVLVDYKTDWVRPDAEVAEDYFRNKYAGQIREYLEALRALSLNVHSAYLLLARTGAAIQMRK